jgi:hypothetical protein
MINYRAAVSEILFENGPIVLKIGGNSMNPFYCNGQLVTIAPLSSQPLCRGKCYVYLSHGTIVLHRLLWIFKQSLYMAGDRNNYIEKISAENIIGMPLSDCNKIQRSLINCINIVFFPFFKITRIFRIRSKILYIIFKRS